MSTAALLEVTVALDSCDQLPLTEIYGVIAVDVHVAFAAALDMAAANRSVDAVKQIARYFMIYFSFACVGGHIPTY
jgi:hypothetical protein